jgi:hypothetical protein
VQTLAPGAEITNRIQLFAGAKEWAAIRAYDNDGVIPGFINSIDWGWFFFLTKPIFAVLHWLHGFIGNMGLAIIALTFVLKTIVLPLAYKSYVSMARMKELQPEMEALKERAGEDKQKLQREMMQLYKDKKVNPAAGCLPILIQIPIFFSLYKVIFVTIELRHAPFFGWLKDLSAPDPSSLYNLFGLLPWDAPVQGSLPAPDLHRRAADPAGHHHVAAAEAEPGARRSGPGLDLRLDALGLHVHAGRFRQRAGGLLDHQQHDHLHPAVPDHVEPRETARHLRQHPLGQGCAAEAKAKAAPANSPSPPTKKSGKK